MPTPDKPSLDYSYTAFQEGQGDNAFPGTFLDNDLANLKASIDETIDFVGGVIRDDGKLANAVVTKASLDESLLLGIKAPTAWATATSYAVDDTVFTGNTLYIAVEAHTSADFATDLANGHWSAFATFEPLSSVSDGSITEPKHATGGVSTRALADNSVTAAKVPDGAFPLTKLTAAAQATVVPVGAEVDFSGVFAPAGWVFKAGQALSRVTYAALFGVLCPAVIGTVANGSNTVSGLTVDLRGLGIEGASIEGAGVPTGATVASVTQTTIVMSVNATASTVGAQIRVFPHGNGDGSTTFTLPDDRGRATIGRDGMGGTPAGRVTTTGVGASDVDGSKLGSGGGVDRHAITPGQMPLHAHSGSVAISDPGHVHKAANNKPIQTSSPGGNSPDYLGGSQLTELADGTTLAFTGISATLSVNAIGGDQAHPNVQPSRVANKIIFTGVM